jgi:tellurite resistance protein TerC
MIGGGVALVRMFHWTAYLFGAILLWTAVKLFFKSDEKLDPERNSVVRWFRRHFRVTSSYERDRFFTRQEGRWTATPLFIVLLVIETTDLVFAVDSVPAVIGLWDPPSAADPMIVYTSNVFAILGLRSLYFVLASLLESLRFLHLGLALILAFIGAKMVTQPHLPNSIKAHMTTLSLCVIGGVLLLTATISLLFPKKPTEGPAPPSTEEVSSP